MIGVIRTAMSLLGYRSSAIERRLGWRAGYLSRLLNGGMELRFEHVLDIAVAMELRPGELFSIAYPESDESPSPSAQRLREVTGGFRETTQARRQRRSIYSPRNRWSASWGAPCTGCFGSFWTGTERKSMMDPEAEEQARESKARRRQEIEREIDAFLAALRKYLLFLADRVGVPPGDQE
jgi:hypothetical protein